MALTISYETGADGFGDDATEDDMASFAAFVEERLEERFPGATVTADVDASVLASRCRVTGDDSINETELAQWVGNDLWDEWCSSQASSPTITRVRPSNVWRWIVRTISADSRQ